MPYSPVESLFTVRTWSVALEVMVTGAPAITAPVVSVTVPRIAPVVDVCPTANCTVVTDTRRTNTTLHLREERKFQFISEPLGGGSFTMREISLLCNS